MTHSSDLYGFNTRASVTCVHPDAISISTHNLIGSEHLRVGDQLTRAYIHQHLSYRFRPAPTAQPHLAQNAPSAPTVCQPGAPPEPPMTPECMKETGRSVGCDGPVTPGLAQMQHSVMPM